MSRPRLYVFDWDGTLIDSVSRIVSCLRTAAADLGFPLRSDAEYGDVIGLGLPQAIATLYPGMGEQEAELYRDRYADNLSKQLPCTPAVKKAADFWAVVEAGRKLGDLHCDYETVEPYLVAVATGKSRRGLDRVMARHGLMGFFHATRCADETASKPEPLMLMQIFEELGVSSSESLMVGDTEFDLDMAARAGARSVGVSYGVHSKERLLRHRPERIISSITELRA